MKRKFILTLSIIIATVLNSNVFGQFVNIQVNNEFAGGSISTGPKPVISFETSFDSGFIYYTLDGSAPSVNSNKSARYLAPFILNASADINAIAYSSDYSERAYAEPVSIEILETFKLNIEIEGGGKIQIDPEKETYLPGSEVNLIAVPDIEWIFAGWSGDLNGRSKNIWINIDKNKTIVAKFVSKVKNDPIYKDCIEAWDFNNNIKSIFSEKELTVNEGKPRYINTVKGRSALRIQKGQYFSAEVNKIERNGAISFWIYSAGISEAPLRILNVSENSESEKYLNLSLQSISLESGDSLISEFNSRNSDIQGTSKTLTEDIFNGQWNHISIVFNVSSIRHYLNGRLIRSQASTKLKPDVVLEKILIGWLSDVSYKPIICIDELKIFSKSISNSEITNIYNTEKKSYEAPGDGLSNNNSAINGWVKTKENKLIYSGGNIITSLDMGKIISLLLFI